MDLQGEASKREPALMPTVSIYQNADYVAGLVQQLFEAPLITAVEVEGNADTSKANALEGSVGIDIDATAKVPLVTKAAVDVDLKGTGSRSTILSTGSRSTQSFVYSQAYYLNLVRKELKSRGLLKSVNSVSEAKLVSSGDFVEYEAAFDASELTTFMDVLSPDLVAQIATWLTKRSELATFDGYDNFQSVQIASLRMNEMAQARAALARDVTRAVQADFRRDKTREYYGRIGEGDSQATAITICDNAHFVVEDEDRILDGRFKVLGKVTSSAEENVPVLGRNKLLKNISVSGVDALFDQAKAALAKQDTTRLGSVEVDQLLDLQLASRVSGWSIRVMPVAIFV